MQGGGDYSGYGFLRRVSLAAFLVALGLFVVELALAAWALHPDRITMIPERYLLDAPGQDRIHTTYLIAKLRREYRPEAIKVFVIGGSSIRDLPEDKLVERELQKRLGRDVQYAALGNYSSSVLDTYVVASALPRDERTVFVHGLTPNRFQLPVAMDTGNVFNFLKIPFVWMYARDELSHLGGFTVNETLLRIRDAKNFIQVIFATRVNAALQASLEHLRQGEFGKVAGDVATAFAPMEHIRYQNSPMSKMVSKARLVHLMATQETQGFMDNKEAGYRIFDDLIDTTSDVGAKHIFFLGPWSPGLRKAIGEVEHEMCAHFGGVAGKHPGRVDVMDCWGGVFKEEAFHDPVHMHDAGREMMLEPFSDMLANHVKRLVPPRSGE